MAQTERFKFENANQAIIDTIKVTGFVNKIFISAHSSHSSRFMHSMCHVIEHYLMNRQHIE